SDQLSLGVVMRAKCNFTQASMLGAFAAALIWSAGALADEERYVAFVTCPLLRDTPELPCWMARDGDTLYYLGIQSGRAFATTFFPPQMKHKMLVEGSVSSGPPVCGGVVLENLHVSPLPEV